MKLTNDENTGPSGETPRSEPALRAGRGRTGKIARLPLSIRQELNRRLQDGEQGSLLVEWLNSRPEVRAVLAAQYHGKPIGPPNLSAWRMGGYRDWEKDQQALGAVAILLKASTQPRAANGDPIHRLTLALTAKMGLELHRLNSLPNAAEKSRILRELASSLAILRRGDLESEQLRVKQAKLILRSPEIPRKTDAGDEVNPGSIRVNPS